MRLFALSLRFHLVVSFVFGYMFMAKISSSEVGFADLKNKGGSYSVIQCDPKNKKIFEKVWIYMCEKPFEMN